MVLNCNKKTHFKNLDQSYNRNLILSLDRSTPPKRGIGNIDAIFGPQAPESQSYEDICGPLVQCPTCLEANKDAKCKDALPLYDLVGHLEVKPSDPFVKYPGLPNRTFGKVN